ncbi:hypothetical protein Nepgr_032393 [Nepenthes gracilis]|uniref:Uncharacterized protein n=1 Tax=Nepenthes gracilis TaxID=150966 RepID=A0AAD3TJ67_NEPGR|nr:hypothetical protein Nepgr_032393 [Nepenthes gracilis]
MDISCPREGLTENSVIIHFNGELHACLQANVEIDQGIPPEAMRTYPQTVHLTSNNMWKKPLHDQGSTIRGTK